MTKDSTENNSIVKTDSANLAKAGNVIQITNKLIQAEVNKLFNKAFYLLNSNDIAEAQEDFCNNLINDPTYLRSFSCFANSESDYRKAINVFTQVVNIKPSFKYAYNFRGVAKFRLNNYKTAINDLNKAVTLDKNYADAYLYRGDIYYYNAVRNEGYDSSNEGRISKTVLDKYKSSLKDYSKVLEINSHYNEAYFRRGRTKFSLTNYHAALEDFNKVIKLNSTYAIAYDWRARLLLNFLNNYESAIKDYTVALKLNHNKSEMYLGRGIAKARLDKHEAAILDFDRAIKLDPDMAIAYGCRAESKKDLGNHKDWKEDYRIYHDKMNIGF